VYASSGNKVKTPAGPRPLIHLTGEVKLNPPRKVIGHGVIFCNLKVKIPPAPVFVSTSAGVGSTTKRGETAQMTRRSSKQRAIVFLFAFGRLVS